ncbi:MAG: GNAT family N-acetyltransferase [Paracoccaceae bacterium]
MTRDIGNRRYIARFASSEADIRAAQRLRHRVFIVQADAQPRPGGLDRDGYDAQCRHVLVEEVRSGRLVCCFRLLQLRGGAEIEGSYSAQYYDLSRLRNFPGPMVEVGRFCICPDFHDPDIMRVAWASMTRFVDEQGIEMMFGCSSFAGIDARQYLDVFGLLNTRHLAPKIWRPRVKSTDVFRFSQPSKRQPEALAMAKMPPLLRSYLSMGGWVSDHAVLDYELNTLHVFTGLEVKAISPKRARLLRAIAG